jgi:hypothetical protein
MQHQSWIAGSGEMVQVLINSAVAGGSCGLQVPPPAASSHRVIITFRLSCALVSAGRPCFIVVKMAADRRPAGWRIVPTSWCFCSGQPQLKEVKLSRGPFRGSSCCCCRENQATASFHAGLICPQLRRVSRPRAGWRRPPESGNPDCSSSSTESSTCVTRHLGRPSRWQQRSAWRCRHCTRAERRSNTGELRRRSYPVGLSSRSQMVGLLGRLVLHVEGPACSPMLQEQRGRGQAWAPRWSVQAAPAASAEHEWLRPGLSRGCRGCIAAVLLPTTR